MNEQKIPFSIDKMKDAIRYETRDGREVTQVTVFDINSKNHAHGVVNGSLYNFDSTGRFGNKSISYAFDLLIVVEKQIEYPCLCWVSDIDENPNREICQAIALMCSRNQESNGDMAHWKYSTPLTDDELAEFGLMRAEKCAN